MPPSDLRTFCMALGFTAIVIKGQPGAADSAKQARDFGQLIEQFCLSDQAANENAPRHLDETIEKIKSDLQIHGTADLNYDRASLLRLYSRLVERHATYANDDMVAGRVLELIDAEIDHENGRRH